MKTNDVSNPARARPPAHEVARLEALAADALPCLCVERYDGWRLRAAGGVTRRCNSVLAEAAGALPLDEKLAAVEAFYARQGLPPRLQLSPASQPVGLDEALERRGYRYEDGAVVMTANALRLARLGRLKPPPGMSVSAEVDVPPPAAWLSVLQALAPDTAAQLPGRAEALQAGGRSVVWVTARAAETPVGVGLGVAIGDALGIFNMAVMPAHRRRGVGGALLLALADHAAAAGQRQLYLQVADGNVAARALYGRYGLVERYRYHYRVRSGG